jgi:hypothetical protein
MMAFKFDVMETVYIVASAEKGYLEKVTIKRRFTHDDVLSADSLPVNTYESSFNRVYLENELATLEEANDIIEGG